MPSGASSVGSALAAVPGDRTRTWNIAAGPAGNVGGNIAAGPAENASGNISARRPQRNAANSGNMVNVGTGRYYGNGYSNGGYFGMATVLRRP